MFSLHRGAIFRQLIARDSRDMALFKKILRPGHSPAKDSMASGEKVGALADQAASLSVNDDKGCEVATFALS